VNSLIAKDVDIVVLPKECSLFTPIIFGPKKDDFHYWMLIKLINFVDF
jgi:hypothetical protein